MTGFPPQGSTPSIVRVNTNVTLDFAELTAGVSDAKGAWVQLSPGTTMSVNYYFVIPGKNSVATRYLIDIGIGASGSQVVEIPNIPYHVSTAGLNIITVPYQFKVEFPPGIEIWARCACETDSATVEVSSICQGLLA